MYDHKSRWVLLCSLLAVAGCSVTKPKSAARVPALAHPPASGSSAAPIAITLEAAGVDGTAIDQSVAPCEDFYRFACGKWIERTTIPGDKPRWVRSFSTIFERNERALRDILQDEARRVDSPGVTPSPTRKLGRFYAACMDTKVIEDRALKPVAALLARARQVRDPSSVARAVTELHRHGIWALFSLGAEQDYKDAKTMIGRLDQAGLGLPDRNYYLGDDARSKKLRATYHGHVERMMRLLGYSPARAMRAAKRVIRIETELARVSKTRVQRRDPHSMYNRIDRAGVEKLAPAFDWGAYFKGLGHPALRSINVTSTKFFAGVQRLIDGEIKAAEWRDYLQWQIIDSLAGALTERFVDEAFTMKRALSGETKQRERWKRCVSATDWAMGELLAQPYVQRHFAGDAKPAALRMVHEIGRAFDELVGTLDWMDDDTRKRAKEKLKKMGYLIGYPDRWREYTFEVNDVYVSNLLAARQFHLQRELKKIGKPVDRDEWQMSPPTVNAYYDPQRNHMVFPAGVLQPPFYDQQAAVAVNLGAMGMVVGHELTHGFDDKGSLFDGDGNLRDWWTKPVKRRFEAKTKCVVDQYAAYEPLPGVKLNGKLTAGENIADMAGVKLAFKAYRAMRAGKTPLRAGGRFSEDQLFFLSNAQLWCAKQREAFARMTAKVDPHSPPHFRVNGPLSNLPEFADAFSCQAATPMRPERTCSVW